MTSKKDAAPAPDQKAEASAPVAKKSPTPAQLKMLRKGGDYRFNPATGDMVQTRKPAKAANPEAK